MQRLFFSSLVEHIDNDLIILDESSSHYLCRVMRLNDNEPIELFDGMGHSLETKIHQIHKKNTQLIATKDLKNHPKPKLSIHLGLGISKGDRFDNAVQKCTELGISSITPLITQHIAVRLKAAQQEKKIVHWQKIAISACEQSGNNFLPNIHNVCSLDEWLTSTKSSSTNDGLLKLCLDPNSQQGTSSLVGKNVSELSILIGPEGGLHVEEVEQSISNGFVGMHLGPNILRTETAPVAMCAIAQHLFSDNF